MNYKKKLLVGLASLFSGVVIIFLIGVTYFNYAFFKESPKYFSFSSDYRPIKFALISQKTAQNHLIEKASMMIPAKIEGIPNKLVFQFDTGAGSTIVYKKSLESLESMGLQFKTLQKDGKQFIKKLSITLGGSLVHFEMLEIADYSGESFTENDTLIHKSFGSIGSDFMSDQITEIDFANSIIQLYKERPDWMTIDQEFESFDFRGRRLMLPCIIGDKKQMMYYDSGSSSFGLITTKKEYENYTNTIVAEVNYELLSWGRASWWNGSIQVYEKQTDKMATIAGKEIGLSKVSYVDIFGDFQMLLRPFTKIDGWLGNIPFLEHSLIFDAPKQEFLIMEK